MLLLLFSTALLIFLSYHSYWKRRNLPPGPIPLPFIGNMASLGRPNPGYECFRQWRKEYGDSYTFWMGSEPYVIISGYQLLKETFLKDGDTFADKKPQKFQEMFRGGNYGVIESNGEVWKEHRRFAIHQLRDLGFGKDLMQQKILIEVEEMFKKYDEKLGEEQNIPKILDLGVANVMNELIFGYRFDKENMGELDKLQELIGFHDKSFSSLVMIFKVFAPSFIGNLLPGPTVKEVLNEFKTDFYSFFNSQIDKHRATMNWDPDRESEDYAEAYLKEQRKREQEGDFESFNNKQLSNMCLDLWFAGLATTTTTLSWSLAYLMNSPGVQEKMHEELDRVIGSDRLVTTADKNDLPYMQAFINESQRCANIVPINFFHMTTRDTEIGGFKIPAGTGIIPQIATVLLDETVFPEPYKFNPDRFIENGKLKKVEELVPFSIGKRQCLGEGLARMELFLFIANFFNRYHLKAGKGGLPCIDKTKEFKVTPRSFNGILIRRY